MSVLTRPVSPLPLGTSVSRFITAKALGSGDHYKALRAADEWRDTPEVKATLELYGKAAVVHGDTSTGTWAPALAQYGIAQEAITLLRGLSILGALEGQMRRLPLHTKVPVETGTGVAGGWVPVSGGAVPASKTAFATSIEEHYLFGVIVALSEELASLSAPDAEATVRRAVLGGLAAGIDTQLLTPTVAAVAGTNPASLTNGSTEITTTGTTSAQISADLAGMLAAVTSPGPLVWIMKPKTMYRIALVLGSQAAGLPSFLFGIPVIASNNSPAQVTLLDPGAMLFSDSGRFDLDVSREAIAQLDTAPTTPPTAATVYQTFYQFNLVGVKALRWLAWLNPSPTTTASYMTVAY